MITLRDITKITKGSLDQGNFLTEFNAISIDSRSIKQKSVFIAIKGSRYDGHDFIRFAIRNGAKAVIVSRRVSCSNQIAVIRVKDTTKALGQIARWHRNRFNIPVIAVTGSAGKTTTKNLIAAILETRFKVLRNKKTENNHFGVPLTLLKLNASHKFIVLELGTNQPGDMRWLASIAQPTIAIFTNISDSHLERLKNRSGVYKEKAQMVKFMDSKGIIIANGDDHYFISKLKKDSKQKIIHFGFTGNLNVKARNIKIVNNQCLQFNIQRHVFIINSPATHNAYNALAAISCGLHNKISYNDIKGALKRFRFKDSRQEIIKSGRFWFIDDTYNANPISLKSAINTLSTLRVNGKKIIVCSDMLELGEKSKALHQSAGKLIAQSSIDIVLTFGHHARHITHSLNQYNGNIRAIHCEHLSDVHNRLRRICHPGDAVLVKGSRGTHMERTITYLKNHFH